MARLVRREAPIFRGTCGVPQDVGDSQPYGYEEAGTLWLWAWPQLLGWPADIAWLFSPVVGFRWPGDLWGVDSEGNLILVEAKAAIRGTGTDPFKDFLGFRPPTIAALRKRWSKRYADERAFVAAHRTSLREGRFEPNMHRGVVPYSRKRLEVRRWRSIYLRHIAPKLMGRRYQERAEAYLQAYEKAGSSAPQFFALFTLLGSGHAALSPKGERHYQMLTQEVGADRLHMVEVQARQVRRWFCEIQSYGVDFATPAPPLEARPTSRGCL